MGKKKKAPGYQTTTYNSGLWGSSTSGKEGTSYAPEGWMNKTMGTVGRNLNPLVKSMLNNDFMSDKNFQRYQQQFTDNMNQLYDATVLSNLANRGLMRSSGLQGATNAFADTLANNQLNLYDNYYNRLSNNLSNLLNTSNTLYNYMTGANAASMNNSNNVSNYGLNAAQFNAGQSSKLGNILNGAVQGAQAGSAAGPWGALGGAVVGGVGGAMK